MRLSVQAMELAWVGFNYIGFERTTTAEAVPSVADIHLAYMPYSHSVWLAAVDIRNQLGRPFQAY